MDAGLKTSLANKGILEWQIRLVTKEGLSWKNGLAITNDCGKLGE
jgi:hypothetical protein